MLLLLGILLALLGFETKFYIAQAGLEFLTEPTTSLNFQFSFFQPPKCWDRRHALLHLAIYCFQLFFIATTLPHFAKQEKKPKRIKDLLSIIVCKWQNQALNGGSQNPGTGNPVSELCYIFMVIHIPESQ